MTTQGQGRQWSDVREDVLLILAELVRIGNLETWPKAEDEWMNLAQEHIEKVAAALEALHPEAR